MAEGAFVNAGEPIATVASQQDLVVRADVPERYFSQLSEITTANVKMPYSDRALDLTALSGRRISAPSEAMATTPGYIPVYFSFRNDGTALAGGYVQVYLQGAVRHDIITLPIGAISEQQGKYYVYRRIDDECYQKLSVTLGANDGARVEILSGVEPA